jgi:hypothetical protein
MIGKKMLTLMELRPVTKAPLIGMTTNYLVLKMKFLANDIWTDN